MESDKKSLTYNSYLKVDELISLQRPLSSPVAHDEMLFIVIHQAYELWFKLVLFELDEVVKRLATEDYLASFRGLDRVCEIFRVLIQQIDILETMTPVEFNRFRTKLNPASGFQSLQFRELELASGADPTTYTRFSELQPEWKDKLALRLAKPTLRRAFLETLARKGLIEDVSNSPEVVQAISKLYSEPKESSLQALCEYLIRYDEQISHWRFRHVQMVERMIGMKPGTGGSLGVAYLQQTLKKRFFPELWEARTAMGEAIPYGNKT